MNSRNKRLKSSFEKPDIIKFNINDRLSIFRALEDAGAEVPWAQISKDHKSFTDRLKSSTTGFLDAVEHFLEEFTEKNNKLSVIFLKPIDTEQWKPIVFREYRKRKIFIRQERKDDYEFTALFYIEHPSFKQANTLHATPNSNFPQHWPPKHFVGCKQHIELLENLWNETFIEVNRAVNEARGVKNQPVETSINDGDGDVKKPLKCGLFARPKSGKSYCFNRLLLSGLISESYDFATIGPSTTSNAIHTAAVTKLPIRAIYNADQLVISLKDVNSDQQNEPLIIYENSDRDTPTTLTKAHLEQIVTHINRWNGQRCEKTAYIELLIPSPFLKAVNIELIDLPGYVATADDRDNAHAEHINDTIAVYLNAKQGQCPLLDAVIFLAPGRKVSETVFLDLYRSGYFSANPILLPKLIYLVNSLEGLEKSVDYQDEKLETNIAKAREEVKEALTYFMSHEENLVYGIDADCVNIIFKRAASTPFFRSTFRGFDTISELNNIFLEIRFHKLRCRMLGLIKEELVNHIVVEKLKLIPKTTKEKTKLGNLLKEAADIETKYKKIWQTLNKKSEQEKYGIRPDQYLHNKKSEDAIDPNAPEYRRIQLYYWLKKHVDGYINLLHEYSQGEKIKLIDKLRELNSKTYPTTDDGSRSEAFHLIEGVLNEALENIHKDIPRGSPLPSKLCDAVDRTSQTSNFSKMDEALLCFLKDTIREMLTSDNSTSLTSYTLALCQRNTKQVSETLQKKVIKYENLLRSLHNIYSFFTTSNGKEKELLRGMSDGEIHRHPAAYKDKELENEMSNSKIASYLVVLDGVSPGNGTVREITVEFDIGAKQIQIHHNISEVLNDLRRAGCYQDNLICPIFIPTKLRGRSRAGTTDVEIVTPQLYNNQLNDFPNTFVIPVVDKSEAKRYRDYIENVFVGHKMMIVIDDSNSEIPINIGRKRHVIKMVAEQMLKLIYYWVIDDDIELFVEFGDLLYRAPCSIGRALNFAQRVLKHELNINDYESKIEDLFYKIGEVGPDKAAECWALQTKCRKENKNIAQFPDEFRTLCEKSNFADELRNIEDERLRRVGQIALYKINTQSSEKRNFLIKKGNYSHINRGERYQIVLFNRGAMEDIDYMSREDFFKPYCLPDAISFVDQSPSDKKEIKAKEGSMHEDWAIVRQMKAKGRLGYLVFRYGFSNFDRSRYPSLVHKISKDVPTDKAIPMLNCSYGDDDHPPHDGDQSTSSNV